MVEVMEADGAVAGCIEMVIGVESAVAAVMVVVSHSAAAESPELVMGGSAIGKRCTFTSGLISGEVGGEEEGEGEGLRVMGEY